MAPSSGDRPRAGLRPPRSNPASAPTHRTANPTSVIAGASVPDRTLAAMPIALAGLHESCSVIRMWSFREGSSFSLLFRIRSAVNSIRCTIFVDLAFSHAGLDREDFVRVDPALVRPAEVDTLLADPTKAREELDWHAKTRVPDLVRIMVDADIEAQERRNKRLKRVKRMQCIRRLKTFLKL